MATDTITARVSHRTSAAPEQVFDAWLDPEQVRTWMSMALKDFGLAGDIRRVEIELRVGGRFVFSDMRDEGEAVHWGTSLNGFHQGSLPHQVCTSEVGAARSPRYRHGELSPHEAPGSSAKPSSKQ